MMESFSLNLIPLVVKSKYSAIKNQSQLLDWFFIFGHTKKRGCLGE